MRVDGYISDHFPCAKQDVPVRRHASQKKTSSADAYENCENSENVLQVRGKRQRLAARQPLQEANAQTGEPLDFASAGPDMRSTANRLRKENRQGYSKENREGAMTNLEDKVEAEEAASPAKCLPEFLMPAVLKTNFAPKRSNSLPRQKQCMPPAVARLSRTTLHNLESPPFDWSLKTSVRISSQQPIKCCQDGRTAPSSSASQSMHAFVRDQTSTLTSSQAKWQSTLWSWQHPDVLFEPATVALLKSEKAGGTMEKRRCSWQASLTSAYYNLRNEKCQAFYIISPKGVKNPFVVFFGAAGVAGRPQMHALVSRSTRGTREILGNIDLKPTMPLAPFGAVGVLEERHREELINLGQIPTADTVGGVDNKASSLLEFKGTTQVHGIFNWLLDIIVRPDMESCDVPMILAPTVFQGASLQKHQPQILPVAGMPQNGNGGLHRVEIRGPLPPWTLARICKQLSTVQDSSFKVYMETLAESNNLNGSRSIVAPGKSRCELSNQESSPWLEPDERLSGLVVRELESNNGVFTVQLAPV